MNDQLRTLVRQAVVAVDIVTGNEALDDELAKMYIPDCFADKFAELIVKECMEVAGASYTSTPEDCVYYVDLAVNRIAEHFGVEE